MLHHLFNIACWGVSKALEQERSNGGPARARRTLGAHECETCGGHFEADGEYGCLTPCCLTPACRGRFRHMLTFRPGRPAILECRHCGGVREVGRLARR